MNRDTEGSPAEPTRDHRRGVRLFVAAHLCAVCAIYAVALIVGGGFAGPPMPPLTVAMADPSEGSPLPVTVPTRTEPGAAASPAPSPQVPHWTERAEVSAPWESR